MSSGLTRLQAILREMRSVVVAYSGGVDSTFLAAVAHEVLGQKVLAVTAVSPLYQTYDYREFSEDSARWAVDFVEKLMLLRWQPAVKDLKDARDPLENGFFAEQAAIDAETQKWLKKDPGLAAKYLTELTISRMEKVVKLFRELRKRLLTKYSGDIV